MTAKKSSIEWLRTHLVFQIHVDRWMVQNGIYGPRFFHVSQPLSKPGLERMEDEWHWLSSGARFLSKQNFSWRRCLTASCSFTFKGSQLSNTWTKNDATIFQPPGGKARSCCWRYIRPVQQRVTPYHIIDPGCESRSSIQVYRRSASGERQVCL